MHRGLTIFLALACAAPAAGATIERVRLANGSDENNRIGSAIYDTARVAPLKIGSFQAGYDRDRNIVQGYGGVFTRGPSYTLNKAVDLAALLEEALGSEARAMGFRATEGDAATSAAWELSGTLKDIYVETHQMSGYGAVLMYGYMDVEARLRGADGKTVTRRLKSHVFFQRVDTSYGRKDEAEAGLAHLLIEGAQEMLARLNREFFKAPPHRRIDSLITELAASGAGNRDNEIRIIGLAGSPTAVPVLLGLIKRDEDEDRRSVMINALASLGSAEAIAPLSARFGDEDDDCKWYSLKTMDYIGSEDALVLVKNKGLRDEDETCQRLAKRILS
jgi:hypothetical protein